MQDGANFNFLKKQYDPDTSSSSEEKKWVSTGVFPQRVKKGLEKLKKGFFSRSFKTKKGWLIFYLRDKRPGEIKSIEEVDMAIRKIMFQEKFNELMDYNLEILKNNSTIIYFDENIERCFQGQ